MKIRLLSANKNRYHIQICSGTMPNAQFSSRECKKYQTRSEIIHSTENKQIHEPDEVKMDSKIDRKKSDTKNDNTNNYFLLKCLAGFAAAAVFTAGVIAAAVFNSSTVASAGAGLVAGAGAAAATVPMFLGPLLLIAVGTLALMPFLFGCSGGSNYSSTYVRTSPTPYYSSGFWGPSYSSSTFFSSPIVTSGNYHGHPGSGPIHGHGSSGPVHSHPSSGNTHHHGGGYGGGGFGGNVHSHR